MYKHTTHIEIPQVGEIEVELKYQVTGCLSIYWTELLNYKILSNLSEEAADKADTWLADNQDHLNDILQEEADRENPELY